MLPPASSGTRRNNTRLSKPAHDVSHGPAAGWPGRTPDFGSWLPYMNEVL